MNKERNDISIFQSDKMTKNKIVGCVLGFAGIMALNVGGKDSGQFTLLGDGFIILNALCGATATSRSSTIEKAVSALKTTYPNMKWQNGYLLNKPTNADIKKVVI